MPRPEAIIFDFDGVLLESEFEGNRQLAELLTDVRFKPLDSDNHIYVPTERAWDDFMGEVREFLA